MNPVIVPVGNTVIEAEEGCLSVPGIFGDVKRFQKIKCVFFDESGRKRHLTAQGLFARVIQHETDHLDGILFIDKAKRLHRYLTKEDEGETI